MIKKTLAFFLFLISFVFVSPVSAGGGNIYIHADPNLDQWKNSETRMFIVRVHLDPSIECKGRKVIFEYQDPRKGSYITTDSSTSTSIINEISSRVENGRSVPDCTTYAKYYSSEKVAKVAKISVEMPDGQVYYREEVVLNFQLDDLQSSNGAYSLPWYVNSTSNPVCTASSIKPVTGNAPLTVVLHGSGEGYSSGGIVGYMWDFENDRIWDTNVSLDPVKHTYEKEGTYQPKYIIKGGFGLWSQTCNYPFKVVVGSVSDDSLPRKINVIVGKQVYNGGPKRTIDLTWNQVYQKSKYNAYVRLSDQKEYGDGLLGGKGIEALSGQISINAYLDYYVKVSACSDECTYSPEVFIPAMKKGEAEMISPDTDKDNTRVDELNQKVNSLQNQLAETQQKQSSLEKNFAAVLTWIKSIFPFFK